MERSAKKVAEGSDASRKYVAHIGLNWRLEIIFDLPFGFPINNIISLEVALTVGV